MKKILYLSFIAAIVVSCKQNDGDYTKFTHDPLLYSKTVKRLNDVVLYNNFPPVIASRNYAYANIAAYECIAAGDNRFLSLSGQIKHLPPMPRPADVAKVDYQLAALLSLVKVGNAVTFPEGVLMDYWKELYKKADSAGMPEDVLKQTIAFSDTIAAS